MGRAAVRPMPPVAATRMPWDVELADPVEALRAERARHGDTFVVDSGGDRYLFLFSPVGVCSFYELDEAEASKGVADWRMLRRKVPPELFDGRRTLPHDLFGRAESDTQLRSLHVAIPRMVGALRPGDDVDVFDWTRRLGHLIGLTSWGGAELVDDSGLDDLVAALDSLDASEAFVRPERMAEVEASGHAAERRALAVAESVIGGAIRTRMDTGTRADDLLGLVIDGWPDGAADHRVHGAALDVVLVHLASMSNLFAAIGWAIVDVVSRPDLVDAIRSGDRDLATRCALESIRRAQRSVMMRHVLEPVTIETEGGSLAVDPGVTVATLLPLTNHTAATGLDTFDPDRWNGRRLGPHADLAARELVTTFGHGRHTCPAQSFSLHAIVTTLEQLLEAVDVTLVDADPGPVRAQIGGVARASAVCRMRLAARP